METARRVRQRVRTVLKWAQAHGFVTENVAGEAIDGALPAMPAVKEHFRALPYPEVPDALRIVAASGASLAARLCFRFLVLTAARSGEVRGAVWSEIDCDAREWRIPGARMKSGTDHRVPLSKAALTVLEQARTLDDGSGVVFPSPLKRGCPLSDMALTKLLRDNKLADRATVHGFRSSFRDWCAETGKPRELAEAALAHTVGGVEGAYFRSDLLAKRRRLMDQWAAFVTDSDTQKVVPLVRRG
jgi:integrase